MEKSHVGMLNCWICGEGAEILLDLRLKNTLSHNMGSSPATLCNECKNQVEKNEAIWLISVRDGESPIEGKIFNPYRTGSICLVKKEALERIFRNILNEDVVENMISMVKTGYYFFLEDKIWDGLGIPRGELNES